MGKLKATEVWVESSFKAFGLDRGKSSGSTVSVKFAIPSDVEGLELRLQVLEEKKRLDLLVLSMEMLRGGISNKDYQETKSAVTATYEKIFDSVKSNKGSELVATEAQNPMEGLGGTPLGRPGDILKAVESALEGDTDL